jgi:hypothetical protein
VCQDDDVLSRISECVGRPNGYLGGHDDASGIRVDLGRVHAAIDRFHGINGSAGYREEDGTLFAFRRAELNVTTVAQPYRPSKILHLEAG